MEKVCIIGKDEFCKKRCPEGRLQYPLNGRKTGDFCKDDSRYMPALENFSNVSP